MLVLLSSTIKVKFDKTKSKVFITVYKALLIWCMPTSDTWTSPHETLCSSNMPCPRSMDTPCHTTSPLCFYSHSFSAGNALAPSIFLSCQTQSRYHLLWKHFWSSPAWVNCSTLKLWQNLRLTSLRAIWPWAQDLTFLILASSSVKKRIIMISTSQGYQDNYLRFM